MNLKRGDRVQIIDSYHSRYLNMTAVVSEDEFDGILAISIAEYDEYFHINARCLRLLSSGGGWSSIDNLIPWSEETTEPEPELTPEAWFDVQRQRQTHQDRS